VAITAVGQGYEWTSIRYDYQIGSGITYGGMGKPVEIGQGKQLKYSRGRCYNCNEEGHTARYCPKERNTNQKPPFKCFKCGQEGHIALGCQSSPQGSNRIQGKDQKKFINRSHQGTEDDEES